MCNGYKVNINKIIFLCKCFFLDHAFNPLQYKDKAKNHPLTFKKTLFCYCSLLWFFYQFTYIIASIENDFLKSLKTFTVGYLCCLVIEISLFECELSYVHINIKSYKTESVMVV